MSRRLTAEERELWDKLRRSVRPLRPQRAEPSSAAAAPQAPAEAGPSNAKGSAPPAEPPARAKAAPPPLARLAERDRRRLARGLTEVEGRIDLHGMRQERAYRNLIAFLRHAQGRGERLVLVVTGKGKPGEGERGVLREKVPAWLALPEFRDLVVGFEEAARRHGGSGALYVRLRRRGRPGRGGRAPLLP